MPPPLIPGRFIGHPGVGHAGPAYTNYTRSGDDDKLDYPYVGQHKIRRCWREEDFIWGESPLGADVGQLYDLSPSGTPTAGKVTNGVDGQYQVKLGNTSERSLAGYYWEDNLFIPATKRIVLDFILEVVTLPSTNERMFFGLITALADILGGVQNFELLSRRVGFSIDADGVLELESDDGTTDNDDQTPQYEAVTLVAGTQYCFRIDMMDIGRISYQIADGDGDNWREIGYLAASALAVSDKLQPGWFVQKDTGTGVPEILLDYYCISWDRSNK